jgi:hypothetical protein
MLLGLEDLAHFQRQALAQVDVEVGEGFVEQDQLRTRRQGAGERDALLLATGEFVRIAVALATQADRGEQVTHPAAPLAGRQAARPKPTLAATVRCGKRA